jgi:hypothetical protein
VSSDDRQTTADTARSTARGEELREELAITDARRAEEEVAKQHEEVEAAQKEEEKLSRKERKAAERAQEAAAAAERAREQASKQADTTVSGATVAGPGTGTGSDPRTQASAARGATAAAAPDTGPQLPEAAQRPEVIAGAAFGGAFILARVLKRLFD